MVTESRYHMPRTYQPTKPNGFTLVEMLVIAPIVLLVTAALIGFMISLVGSVMVSNARTQSLYDIQDSLNQIEQDAFFSVGFLDNSGPVTSPQGVNNDTTAFTSGGATTSNTIIFSQPGTDKNPADASQQLVYHPIPVSCVGQVQINMVLYTKTIYFLKSGVLYRRVIVPSDATTACSTPWQRNTCTTINQGGNPLCVAKDAKLLTNVSAFSVTYFNKANPGTTITDPTQADSLKVSITTSTTAAGATTNSTLELSASKTNK